MAEADGTEWKRASPEQLRVVELAIGRNSRTLDRTARFIDQEVCFLLDGARELAEQVALVSVSIMDNRDDQPLSDATLDAYAIRKRLNQELRTCLEQVERLRRLRD